MTRAATPAACGEAIEVPLNTARLPSVLTSVVMVVPDSICSFR